MFTCINIFKKSHTLNLATEGGKYRALLCRALGIEYRAFWQHKTDANTHLLASTFPRNLAHPIWLPKVSNIRLLCRALLSEYRALLQHKIDANTYSLASTFPRNRLFGLNLGLFLIEYTALSDRSRTLLQHKRDASTHFLRSTLPEDFTHPQSSQHEIAWKR